MYISKSETVQKYLILLLSRYGLTEQQEVGSRHTSVTVEAMRVCKRNESERGTGIIIKSVVFTHYPYTCLCYP